ncbi:MAG: polymer-forming cytoskeletal protein [Hyphomicrobiaceae bacterium]
MFNPLSTTKVREAEAKRPITNLSENPIANTPPAIPQLPAAKPALVERAEAGKLSIIGNDLAIMGERIVIITKGILQVDGEVQADLHGSEVIIGEAGKVTGTIWADVIEIRGQVHGTIKGTKVQLMGKSTVEGDIHHQTLMVVEGANFDGRVRRPADINDLKPMLDPSQHASKTPTLAA